MTILDLIRKIVSQASEKETHKIMRNKIDGFPSLSSLYDIVNREGYPVKQSPRKPKELLDYGKARPRVYSALDRMPDLEGLGEWIARDEITNYERAAGTKASQRRMLYQLFRNLMEDSQPN